MALILEFAINCLIAPPPIHKCAFIQKGFDINMLVTRVCGPEGFLLVGKMHQALKIHLPGIYLAQCVFLHTMSQNIYKTVMLMSFRIFF